MSLNLTGLADVAERSLQQITEIADDRRQTLDGAKHHAHVDVRLNELEESALSSLLMPMLPAHLLGTEERGARAAGDEESMEAADRPPSPSRLEEGDFLLCFTTSGPSDLQLETARDRSRQQRALSLPLPLPRPLIPNLILTLTPKLTLTLPLPLTKSRDRG